MKVESVGLYFERNDALLEMTWALREGSELCLLSSLLFEKLVFSLFERIFEFDSNLLGLISTHHFHRLCPSCKLLLS